MAIRDSTVAGQAKKSRTSRTARMNSPPLSPARPRGAGTTSGPDVLRRHRDWEILAAQAVSHRHGRTTADPLCLHRFRPSIRRLILVSDFSNLIAAVWRQLDVECPRFETASSWIRLKQGATERPLIRQSGQISTALNFIKGAANAGFSWVPGINLITSVTDRLGQKAVSTIERTSLGEYLLKKTGGDDYLHLSRMAAQDIYPTLTKRIGEDLDEWLPKRGAKRCRGVIFLDTLEVLPVGKGRSTPSGYRRAGPHPCRN